MIDVELFRKLIDAREFKQLRQHIDTLEIADLAEIIGCLQEEREFIIAFRLLKRAKRGLVFANLPADSQEKLLAIFPNVIVRLSCGPAASPSARRLSMRRRPASFRRTRGARVPASVPRWTRRAWNGRRHPGSGLLRAQGRRPGPLRENCRRRRPGYRTGRRCEWPC